MKLLRSFLDLLFPPQCFSCNKRLENSKNIICTTCSSSLIQLENICPVCGNKLTPGECSYCKSNNWYFEKVISLFPYNRVVQDLIHNFKYNELTKISNLFAEYFSKFILEQNSFAHIDLVLPVPIHSVRKRARGYNQAEFISRKIARLTAAEHLPNLVRRKRFTLTQTRLTKNERKANVADAFTLKKGYDISDKNVLLVDDVFTTGSTVNSISKLLRESNCGKVYVFTVSHA